MISGGSYAGGFQGTVSCSRRSQMAFGICVNDNFPSPIRMISLRSHMAMSSPILSSTHRSDAFLFAEVRHNIPCASIRGCSGGEFVIHICTFPKNDLWFFETIALVPLDDQRGNLSPPPFFRRFNQRCRDQLDTAKPHRRPICEGFKRRVIFAEAAFCCRFSQAHS